MAELVIWYSPKFFLLLAVLKAVLLIKFSDQNAGLDNKMVAFDQWHLNQAKMKFRYGI